MNATPRVTAIITNYNYGRFLRDAIESVLAQSYYVSQVVVVDDGSTDDSREVLEGLQCDLGHRLQVLFEENGGQAAAINAGCNIATGDYVAMLDADDYWLSKKIERVLEVFADNPNAGMLQHRLQLVGRDGTENQHTNAARLPSGDLFPLLVATGGTNLFEPTSGFVFRREVLERILPLPSDEWRLCADGALAYAAAVVTQIVSIPEALGYYRIHGDNLYAERAKPKSNLYRDLAMTVEYVNRWAELAGKSERVDLDRQLGYRRDRFYEKGGDWLEWCRIVGLISRWPLYKATDKLRFTLRFLLRSALASGSERHRR